MPGEGRVTINDDVWEVVMQTTYAELVSGLSGVESLGDHTGMLFDIGQNTSIDVQVREMLFNIDIVFIDEGIDNEGNTQYTVSGVYHDVEPGDKEYIGTGRFFLEVNAGEAEDVEVGDIVELVYVIDNSTISRLADMFILLPMMGMAAILASEGAKNISVDASAERRAS